MSFEPCQLLSGEPLHSWREFQYIKRATRTNFHEIVNSTTVCPWCHICNIICVGIKITAPNHRYGALIWARFLSLARSKLRLCSTNHRAGYFSNQACGWLSTVWAYSEQQTEKGPCFLTQTVPYDKDCCMHPQKLVTAKIDFEISAI